MLRQVRGATCGLCCSLAVAGWPYLPGYLNSSVGVKRVTVTAGGALEFRFTLSRHRLSLGRVRFVVRNSGLLPHRFKVCRGSRHRIAGNYCVGTETRLILPGHDASITVLFRRKGRYEFLCGVRGHAAAGMKGILVIR